MASENYVRPADESIPLQAPLTLENGTDPRVTTATVPRLESPVSEVAQAVKDVFHDTKKPATVILVLDTSGSMSGDKIKNAAESASNFVGRLARKDEIYVLGFGSAPYPIGQGGSVAEVGEDLKSTLAGTFAGGGTALHDAICQATVLVDELKAKHEADNDPHLYGIVLLSDGADTASARTENQMFSDCLPDGESVEGVKIFTIAYGADANLDLMTRIANRTNGKPFEGTPENIERIYNAISAEQ
jgi:Ca-activated chloride channel family protein